MSHKLATLVVARRDFEREALAAILTDAGFEIGVRDPACDLDFATDVSLTGYQVALIDARTANPLREIASLHALSPALKIALMAEGASTELVQSAFAVGAIGVVDRSVSCAILVRQLELLGNGQLGRRKSMFDIAELDPGLGDNIVGAIKPCQGRAFANGFARIDDNWQWIIFEIDLASGILC